jgi:hypothetical protein
MSSFQNFSIINSLPDFSMIAGNEYTLIYNVYEQDEITPLNLGGATCYVVLSPYGQTDYNILQKTATITSTNTFQVVFLGTDTAALNGWYIQQPVVYSFTGNEYRPSQGRIFISPQIPVI